MERIFLVEKEEFPCGGQEFPCVEGRNFFVEKEEFSLWKGRNSLV